MSDGAERNGKAERTAKAVEELSEDGEIWESSGDEGRSDAHVIIPIAALASVPRKPLSDVHVPPAR